MKLENQLVSKKLSIKLDELGFKTESLYWHKIPNKKCRNGSVASIVEYKEESKWFDYYRAYSVSEIGEMLPCFIENKGRVYWLKYYKEFNTTKGEKHIACAITEDILPGHTLEYFEDTEANSKTLMLIHLLENNLINI